MERVLGGWLGEGCIESLLIQLWILPATHPTCQAKKNLLVK